MNFDEPLDRRGTHSNKWDEMEIFSGVPRDESIAMWVADMDFRSPACIRDALREHVEFGSFGYYGDYSDYRAAICWWMENRHGWQVDPDGIFTTIGLCNGLALCLSAFSEPGDGVIVFSPVYHAFGRVIRAGNRELVEFELKNDNGRYEMDFDSYERQLSGREKIMVLCSPHNPAGRIWTKAEMEQIAEFCKRHDLILIADEIHHDLVYPGEKHLAMPVAVPDISDRLVMMTAPSKTFNTAGFHAGNVTIADMGLRRRFAAVMKMFSITGPSIGIVSTTAAYSQDGAEWVDALMRYLDENRQLFDDRINRIPGLASMKMQATYLAWVDFSGTGMELAEANERVAGRAKIATNSGPTFGKGGDTFLRFNLGTQRAVLTEALDRMEDAFSDLQ